MTIRLQSILSIALATVIMLAGTILALHFLLLQRFVELERDQALQDATRVELTLAQSIQALHALNNDWANWNATCDFVQTEDEDVRHEYIAQNLQDPTLATNAMHAVAYLDAEGGMIWSGGWHPDLESATALPQGVTDLLATRELLRTPPEAGAYGLVLLPEGPMLISARQVRSSEYTGPVCGTLIMGRRLDGEVLKSLRQQTQTQLSIHNGTAHEGADATQLRVVPEQDQLHIDVPVHDIFGNPAIILEFYKPRTVMRKGREAILYAALAVTFSVVALALVIQRLLETRIMSRIRSLGQQAERLAASGMPGQLVYLAGDDEIAGLAGSINTMLHALEDSRRQQVRQLESLKEQEVFLATVLDSLQAGIIQLDPQTHLILDANAFAEKVLGRSREELRGRLCHGLLCPAELGSCPVTDLGHAGDLAVRHLIDATGRRIPVLKSATLLERHGQTILLESFVDITELQAAQEQLRISEETYRTIFTSTGAALVMLDDAGKVALANEEFARMAGVSRELLEHSRPHWTRFFSSDAQPGMQTMLERATERIANLECDFLRHDGNTRHVSFTVADLPQPGWHIISLLDVTGRRQTEAALRAAHDTLETTVAERTRELEQAVRRLRQLDAIKSSFLSSASHELRTPLTSIKGYAETLLLGMEEEGENSQGGTPAKGGAASAYRNFLEIILKHANHMTKMVNDLLHLARLESGERQFEFRMVNAAEAFSQAHKECLHLAEASGLAVRNLLPAEGVAVHADQTRLVQVFRNLLENALKYGAPSASDAGAPGAGQRGEVQVYCQERAGDVVFSVRDQGPGIPKADRERVFERFYRVEKHRQKHKAGSSGLGLAIVRHIVEKSRGAIWVESPVEDGHGTIFSFTLPRTPPAHDE